MPKCVLYYVKVCVNSVIPCEQCVNCAKVCVNYVKVCVNCVITCEQCVNCAKVYVNYVKGVSYPVNNV